MTGSSILIKGIDGYVYKITDLISGNRTPVTPQEIGDYDMAPRSGIIKALNGTNIDLVDLILSSGGSGGSGGSGIKFVSALPSTGEENAVYLRTSDNSIHYFSQGTFKSVASSSGAEGVLIKENQTDTSEIQEMLTIFNN